MINLNTDVTNIQQLESTQFSENQRAILKPVPRFNAAEEQAARLDVSNQAFGEVTEIMSKEDELSLKASKAQVISETLSDVRLKLRDLMQVLHDPEKSFDANSLGQMDSMSNSLIDTVIRTVRDNDNMNIVDPDLLNVYMGGLKSIKNLDVLDKDFYTKLQSIESNVTAQERAYLKATEDLYSEMTNIQKKYEELVNQKQPIQSQESIEKQIIKFSGETLASVTANISPESVIRLLQG